MTRFRASAGFTERWQHFDFDIAGGVATLTLIVKIDKPPIKTELYARR